MIKKTETTIALREVQFYAYHGVMPEEQVVGNKFVVTVELLCTSCEAVFTDRLEDTVSYADLYELVHHEMKQPSQLLEHVAGRICTVVEQRFPSVSECFVRITKCTPPISAVMQGAEVAVRACFDR
ncbi:MAG: dihydroneopterin aldolase [Porphyromonas sp.]|nr:dihydroneopterin aldolase [Porphyromonas sp.]